MRRASLPGLHRVSVALGGMSLPALGKGADIPDHSRGKRRIDDNPLQGSPCMHIAQDRGAIGSLPVSCP